MDKSRFVGGIVCLALAALLGVLNVTLPADKLMFTVGDQNMPWAPVVILGIVGAVLLLTATGGSREKAVRSASAGIVPGNEKAELNKRLEATAWGIFFIMLGGFALVPETVVSKGVWSIGVGIILLGLNAARYMNNIRMSGFTIFLGAISILDGILQFLGWEAADEAFLLIILGVFLLARPWFNRRNASADQQMPVQHSPEGPDSEEIVAREGG